MLVDDLDGETEGAETIVLAGKVSARNRLAKTNLDSSQSAQALRGKNPGQQTRSASPAGFDGQEQAARKWLKPTATGVGQEAN
jgi:hypothetical protein